MKRKSMFLSIAVVLVLLAIYGIWHYSPLRYLTQSNSGSDQRLTAANKNRGRPVVVTKRIIEQPEHTQQSGDLIQPLIVSKQIQPEETPAVAKPQVQVEIPAAVEKEAPPAAVEKKIPPAAPAASSSTKIAQAQTAEAKKPAEPLPPAKKKAALQPDSRHPYSLMLSSCRLPQSARKVVSDYKKVGLKPYVVKVKFKSGNEWLRVLTGHYQTRNEAAQAKKDLRLSNAIVKKTPYTNLIGTYSSLNAMQADLQQIKKLGYSPYFLKTQAGELKLVVGAFVTQKAAENQQAELQAKGIQSMVIN
ncbi:MAG: SPOR domain-containing protein, partial [Desulfobacterales bacterium]